MRCKKILALLGCCMLLSIPLAGCDIANCAGNADLSQVYPWINELNKEDISRVRYEHGSTCVASGALKDVSYSSDSEDIENTYRLLFSPLRPRGRSRGDVDGGLGDLYVKYDFITENGTYSITISGHKVYYNNRYYRFVDELYTFRHADLDCYSFITHRDTYEIYTYGDESVKVGDYDGLSEFEFKIHESCSSENTPKYYLKGDGVDLLILSEKQFIIARWDTAICDITGEKDFSSLFN